jgi:CRISPR/Cas system-associated exonuclease Cas4 (RecB family)
MTCPRQYYLTYVSGDIHRIETEATKHGSRVHEALERYGRDGKPVPEDCQKFTKYVDKLLAIGGEPFFEKKFALTRNLEPCDFEDETAWCRGIIDIGVINKDKAIVCDWKTGKIKLDSNQLKLFAGFVMQHYAVDTVKTAYIWLAHGKTTTETYTREDLPAIWKYFITKAKRLEQSYEKDKWLPKPSGLCRGWCAAGREHCEFWSPKD